MLPQTLQLRVPILMENAIWFMLLAGLSFLLLFYTFWRKRDIKLIVLFLGLGAIAGLLDNVIFIWLDSYEYYPGILEDIYYDMVLGAYFSQVYYVSSVALFIAAFHMRNRWIILFAAMFVGLEFLFLALGIYKLNWWHSGYTAVGLSIYFWLSKKWYSSLKHAYSGFVRWFTLYCLSYIIFINLVAIPLISHHYHFAGGWFINASRDAVAVLVVIMLIKSVVIMLACYHRLPRMIMVLFVFMMWVSYAVMIRLNIMSFKYIWDLAYFAIIDVVVLLACYYLDKALLRKQSGIM